MAAKYTLHPAAFREELLNADWMVAEMHSRASRAKEIAISTAPFDPDDTDGVHYKESFTVSAGKNGGREHDRAYGRLENSDTGDTAADSTALIVEFGNWNNEAHHTMRNAAAEAARE